MNKSEQINELAKALSAAQTKMNGALKDSKNPFFKSSYADLSQVMGAFQEFFAPEGLSVSHLLTGKTISTILMHGSGQFISSETELPVTKQNDPQALGSSITYMRRYALAAITGIFQTDDDGEKAMGRNHEEPKKIKNETHIVPPPVSNGFAPEPAPTFMAPKAEVVGPSRDQLKKKVQSEQKRLGWKGPELNKFISDNFHKSSTELTDFEMEMLVSSLEKQKPEQPTWEG